MELRICIDVDDMARAIDFYTAGLGLRVGRRFSEQFVELLGGSSAIDLLVNPAGSRAVTGVDSVRDYRRHWTPVHLDFVVSDIDTAIDRLLAYGAALEMPVTDRIWGRIAGLADPFGHGIDLLEFRGRGYDEIAPPPPTGPA